MQKIGDQFLWQAKINYSLRVTPGNPLDYDKDEYIRMVEIGLEYFKQGKIDEFATFFMESQYYIPLWVAHIILRFAKPDNQLAEECIQIIKDFADYPIDEKVANEEKQWLKENKNP
ncbi:hypothetical protein GCM10027037_28170 [Mucilaginibacter koreensis]